MILRDYIIRSQLYFKNKDLEVMACFLLVFNLLELYLLEFSTSSKELIKIGKFSLLHSLDNGKVIGYTCLSWLNILTFTDLSKRK